MGQPLSGTTFSQCISRSSRSMPNACRWVFRSGEKNAASNMMPIRSWLCSACNRAFFACSGCMSEKLNTGSILRDQLSGKGWPLASKAPA